MTTTAEAPEDTSPGYEPEGIVRRLQRDLYSTVWRCRRPLLPHTATAGVLAAGLSADAVASAGVCGPVTASMTLAGVAVAGTAAAAARVKRRQPRWARRVLWGGAVSAGWLALAPFGVGAEQVAVLLGVEFGLAARWWQLHRPGYPSGGTPAVEAAAEPAVPMSEAGTLIADWAAYVGSSGGALPGSSLELPRKTRHGWQFELNLARGKQTFLMAVAALDRVASALDVGMSGLIVEPAPADPDTGQEAPSKCRFQVVTDSPIRHNVLFEGPRRVDGTLYLGPFADGDGEAPYRLYTPGSMWSGVIIGGTGIGKSRLVENIAISALSGGDTAIWFLDPQRGVSSPALAQHAQWFTSMDGAEAMLKAAEAILDGRGEESSYEQWTGFTASAGRPGVLIVIDECHNAFAEAAAAKRWARIAREGRKVGLALLCVSQYPGLETFGGCDPLRSSVMEGNAVVMRTTSRSAGQLMAGLAVDPLTLPKIPGYAYVQGSDEHGTRTAPFRNRNTGDGAAKWLAVQPQPDLDVLAATATLAAGRHYVDRNTSTSSGRTASKARVEALRNGHLPEDMAAPRPAPTQVMGEMGEVIDFPRPVTAEDLAAPAEAALTDSHRAVLDAVTAGAARPSEVEAAVNLSPRRVADLLKELVAAGLLVKPTYGRYERAA